MFQLNQLFDLSGKRALVTGSSRGLGFAIAGGLAGAGAEVILNGREREMLDAAALSLRNAGFSAHAAPFDVSDSAEIRRQLRRIHDDIGTIDILVNNAGINLRQPLVDFEEARWQRVLDTNLNGVFLTSQAVAPAMIAQGAGKIINIGSLASKISRPTIAAYAASKGAVLQLTRAMAVEWAPHNIQVNGIGPGYFKTDMNEPLYTDAEFDSWVKGRTPAGRWGETEELIGSAVFLASRASSFVNGQMFYVDGGLLASM